GPKTAYVGVLAVVPMLAAVFATPRVTAIVAIITWVAAFAFGNFASDGNVAAQEVRLIIIAAVGLAAVGAAVLRLRRERTLLEALREAATAEILRGQAETDQLTRLRNRHGLLAAVALMDEETTRTVAVIDCDDLKSVNDQFGHLAGDHYLQAVAGRLSGGLSKNDLVARWGGDEFLVVQQIGIHDSVHALTRMQAAVHDSPMSVDGSMLAASVSIGLAAWTPTMTFDEAVSAADRAMYEAKSAGGNTIVSAT
ncbi:MAG: GGDEF domain-containing protein, partial [Actinobacteria bacterium]|nr:GGDEF domain-containing protein [Actinomycetota bacterium]